MDDQFDDGIRPDPAELEAAKAAIIAFREQHRTLSTAALAIAFIEQRGSATSTELSVLLGLAADEYPSVVLRSSVQGERLACNGRVWKLGAKAIPTTREDTKPDAIESGTELGRIEQPALQVPTFTPKLGAALKALKQELKAPGYRCALWSDGVVEIQRDGQTVTALPREAAEELARFVHGLSVERAT